MRTPKEWFEEELSGEPLTQESVIEVLEMVQKETWNEAIDKAAENADADIYFKGWLAEQEPFVEGEDYEVYVLNQSILKLKL